MFEGLGIPQDEPTVIYEDNKAAIDLSENPCNQGRSKHIARQWHFIRQCQDNGDVLLAKVDGTRKTADVFTKSVSHELFVLFRDNLGLRPSG
eukprot:1098351-Rhodomonas_salina.1